MTNETNNTNHVGINLADVFASIRKASDTNDKVTANLILGLYEHEVSFSRDALVTYFRTDSAKRKDAQTAILSANDDEFAKEIAFIKSEGEKDKSKRDADALETIARRHKSLRNIFHSCMEAVYFLRTGGELDGDTIGPVTALVLAKNKFSIRYRDTDGENVKLSARYSSAALIRCGQKAVDVLLNKKREATTKANAANVAPTHIVATTLNSFNTMIDKAIETQTAAMKSGGQDVVTATLDDMPENMGEIADAALVKLLTLKFAHDGKIDPIDVLDWLEGRGIKLTEVVKRKRA